MFASKNDRSKWTARREFDRSSPRSGRTLSVDRPLLCALKTWGEIDSSKKPKQQLNVFLEKIIFLWKLLSFTVVKSLVTNGSRLIAQCFRFTWPNKYGTFKWRLSFHRYYIYLSYMYASTSKKQVSKGLLTGDHKWTFSPSNSKLRLHESKRVSPKARDGPF